MPRQYRMGRRAEQMEETRRRIVEAAVELHGSVGPARASIKAIAETAGVERLTVYRHFPDEHALFGACTSHWLAAHPPPDPAAAPGQAESPERLRAGLAALYGWYRAQRTMMALTFRDAGLVAGLGKPLEDWQAYLDATVEALAAPLTPPGKGRKSGRPPGIGKRGRRVRALTAHAVDFRTWSSLADHGLTDAEAAGVQAEMILRAVEG